MLHRNVSDKASAYELLNGLRLKHGVLLITGSSDGICNAFVHEVMQKPENWVAVSSSVNGDGYGAISNAKLIYGTTPKIAELFAKKISATKAENGGAVVWINYSTALNESKLANKFDLFLKHLSKALGFTMSAMKDDEAMAIEKVSLLSLTLSAKLAESIRLSSHLEALPAPVNGPAVTVQSGGGSHGK